MADRAVQAVGRSGPNTNQRIGVKIRGLLRRTEAIAKILKEEVDEEEERSRPAVALKRKKSSARLLAGGEVHGGYLALAPRRREARGTPNVLSKEPHSSRLQISLTMMIMMSVNVEHHDSV